MTSEAISTLIPPSTVASLPREWAELKTTNPALPAIQAAGLEHNLAELEIYGLTVLTPEQIGDPSLLTRARAAVLALAEERTGVAHDVVTGAHGQLDGVAGSSETQYMLHAILEEASVFEELLTHRLTLPLVDYYLRTGSRLSSFNGIIKWQDKQADTADHAYGGLHSDTMLAPTPMSPTWPHMFNTNWLLTDYTLENGALAVVPGSHKYGTHPKSGEGMADAVPVEAPAGSVVLFHGGLWHGAFARTNPGLRMSIICNFSGRHFRTLESFRGRVTEEMVARNGPRFLELTGFDDAMDFTDSRGPIPFHKR